MSADGMEFQIRVAVDGDAGQLMSLIESCWAEYPDIVLEVEREVPELRRIATEFRRIGGEFWVVELEGRIVGSVGWSPSAEPGGVELRKLYVARYLRRQGLGSRLCDLVESRAKARGAEFLDLWSDTRFADAHRLYERLGYVRGPSTRELHDLSDTVEFYYRKQLGPPP